MSNKFSTIFFSDDYVWLKVGLPIIVLVALCVYSGIEGPKRLQHFADFLKAPERFDGTEFMVQYTMIKEIHPDRFVVANLKGRRIEVKGKVPPGNEECFISFQAVFRSPGYLELREPWHIYSKDRLKLYVSAIALAGIAIFFIRRFRFNLRRFRFEERT